MGWALTLTILLSGGSWVRGEDLRSIVQTLVEALRSPLELERLGPWPPEANFADGWLEPAGQTYRIRTTVLADGRILRYVFQPAERTPKEAQVKEVWTEMSYPEEKEEEPAPVRHSYIFGSRPPLAGGPAKREPPKSRKTPPGGFFSASGLFPTADKVPQHIRFPSGAERPDRKLTRECRRTDYVFVAEYTWREALPEVEEGKPIPAAAWASRAREEFAEQTIQLAERVLKRRLNKRCDTSELVRWLRKEAKQELCGLLDELDEGKADAIVSRLKRWGLDPQKDFRPQDLERLVTALSSRLRRLDGKAAGPEEVSEWLAGVFSSEDGVTLEERVLLLKKLAESLPSVPLLQALTGASYDFQVTLPGAIAWTNGSPPPSPAPRGGMVGVGGCSRLNVISEDWRSSTTLGEASVRWRFFRGEVPQGFSMFVRTLFSDEDLQGKLLKKCPLADRDKAAAYVKLVRDSEPLLAALRRCRKDESLRPLLDYRRRLSSADREERDRVEQLLTLLGHPPNPGRIRE
jgi:hypothetical protein